MFKLIPDLFLARVHQIYYVDMDEPGINRDSFWQIYLDVYNRFLLYYQQNPDDEAMMNEIENNLSTEARLMTGRVAPVPG